MANPLLRLALRGRPLQIQFQQIANYYGRTKIGTREVVGYGMNGSYTYCDDIVKPFPAIRFREDTPEIKAVKDKEKGDWKKLSIDEKKLLYRASFCTTFAEMTAPTGLWKETIAYVVATVTLALWVMAWLKAYVYPPLPSSFNLENRQAQLRRILDMRYDAVDGISSKWDYENNRWK